MSENEQGEKGVTELTDRVAREISKNATYEKHIEAGSK